MKPLLDNSGARRERIVERWLETRLVEFCPGILCECGNVPETCPHEIHADQVRLFAPARLLLPTGSVCDILQCTFLGIGAGNRYLGGTRRIHLGKLGRNGDCNYE